MRAHEAKGGKMAVCGRINGKEVGVSQTFSRGPVLQLASKLFNVSEPQFIHL